MLRLYETLSSRRSSAAAAPAFFSGSASVLQMGAQRLVEACYFLFSNALSQMATALAAMSTGPLKALARHRTSFRTMNGPGRFCSSPWFVILSCRSKSGSADRISFEKRYWYGRSAFALSCSYVYKFLLNRDSDLPDLQLQRKRNSKSVRRSQYRYLPHSTVEEQPQAGGFNTTTRSFEKGERCRAFYGVWAVGRLAGEYGTFTDGYCCFWRRDLLFGVSRVDQGAMTVWPTPSIL